jgi:hypothetical protein
MNTNEANRPDVVPLMQQTRTWVLLYAFGIAVLVLSLFRADEGKPARGTVVQVAVPPDHGP